MKTISSGQAAVWLSERDNFLILTHLRPDGDALGSAAGLCQGLREAGKTAYLLTNPETTVTYTKYVEEYWAPEDFRHSHVITVDTARVKQFQINADIHAEKVDLAIDHHPSNDGYAVATCLDSGKAACGEVVFDILMELSGQISEKTATSLYVALVADTGCFCYGNTTAMTLMTAAKLIDAGAPNGKINKEIFRRKSKKRLMVEAEIISGMQYFMDGTVGVATLTQEMRRRLQVGEEDVEDIASVPGQIEGVIIAVTLRENGDNLTKVSVRTTNRANANIICAEFGGGGHKMAAGCIIEEPPAVAEKMILEVIGQVWER